MDLSAKAGISSAEAAVPEAPSPRQDGARWLRSLRLRLAVAIAVTVAVTVAGVAWLSLRAARQVVADAVLETAVTTTQYAVDRIEVMADPLSAATVRDALQEVESASPEIESIVFYTREGGGMAPFAVSGLEPAPVGMELARQALASNAQQVLRGNDYIRVAEPVRRDGAVVGAIVARANLQDVIELQQRALVPIGWFTLAAVVILILVVDLLGRPLVYLPIARLRQTMAKVGAGDFSARAPVARDDELGEVAAGLNQMLARMENFNDALQQRVREATVELERKNAHIIETHARVFALREQLAGAEQMAAVGQTAANVAHQVGTPLNLISGYVQLLKEEAGPDSPLQPRLQIIEEQISKVTSTVRTLLDRSRHMGPRVRTGVGSLVHRVCDAIRPGLDAARVRLVFDLPPGDPEILADTTSLELAILNLLSNAVDAMPNGGTLTVSVEPVEGQRVRLRVSDTGQGIAEDLLPRIFEAWVTTKQPGRGTGLGLAITREVIAGHGGAISVESRPGAGTTFTIDLPNASAAGPDPS